MLNTHNQHRIRKASTVMMIRNHPESGIEVFVQLREDTMPFAANTLAFPGGGLNAHENFDIAAIREVFEETGVLLTPPSDTAKPQYPMDVYRRRLNIGSVHFFDVLYEFDTDASQHSMVPMNRWITPKHTGATRRYDVQYYLTALPADQTPDDQCSEAKASYWARPIDLLRKFSMRHINMLAPTWWHLAYLAGCQSVPHALKMTQRRRKANPERIVYDRLMNHPDLRTYFDLAELNGDFRPITAPTTSQKVNIA